MRDPDRIDRITVKLALLWHERPDWRLGQLLSNLLGPGPQDVFHLEDEPSKRFPDLPSWEALIDDARTESPRVVEGEEG